MENASLFEKLKPHIMAIQLICNEEHLEENDKLLSIAVDNNYFDVRVGEESIACTGNIWEKVLYKNKEHYCDVIDMMEG